MPTIGVAIAVAEPYAAQLQRWRVAFGDPLARSIPSHITLIPPTDVPGPMAEVQEHLDEVARRHRAFPLRLRGTATFRPISPVVFMNVTEGISECEMLADDVRQGPLARELPFPYHPHVTVAHHLEEDALDRAYVTLADFDCSFQVDAFHLYLHGEDAVWRPASTFSLQAVPPTSV